MIREDNTFSVTVRIAEIETLREAISRSLMLRVFVGRRTATYHTSDISGPVVERLVNETVEMARLTSEDESGGLPETAFFQNRFADLNLLDPSWESLTPDERISLDVRTEKAAFETDKTITNSEGASFEYARSRVELANTAGFYGEYEGTTAALVCIHIAKTVASSHVAIVDDARMPRGMRSIPFDDEGIPAQTPPIIERGLLRNYLQCAYTARKLGARPTGNGSRAASIVVTISPTNFHLKEGTYAPDEIIRSVETGLYVVELIGFGVNMVTGDYSRGAVGIWIENGEFKYPVQEVSIAGNLRDMLRNIEMVGNDVTFVGSIAAPTLKFGKMVISGA